VSIDQVETMSPRRVLDDAFRTLGTKYAEAMIGMLHDSILGDGTTLAVAAAATPARTMTLTSVQRRWIIGGLAAVGIASAFSAANFGSNFTGSGSASAQHGIGQQLGNGMKAIGATVASLFEA